MPAACIASRLDHIAISELVVRNRFRVSAFITALKAAPLLLLVVDESDPVDGQCNVHRVSVPADVGIKKADLHPTYDGSLSADFSGSDQPVSWEDNFFDDEPDVIAVFDFDYERIVAYNTELSWFSMIAPCCMPLCITSWLGMSEDFISESMSTSTREETRLRW